MHVVVLPTPPFWLATAITTLITFLLLLVCRLFGEIERSESIYD
jgi:hypothetical protein